MKYYANLVKRTVNATIKELVFMSLEYTTNAPKLADVIDSTFVVKPCDVFGLSENLIKIVAFPERPKDEHLITKIIEDYIDGLNKEELKRSIEEAAAREARDRILGIDPAEPGADQTKVGGMFGKISITVSPDMLKGVQDAQKAFDSLTKATNNSKSWFDKMASAIADDITKNVMLPPSRIHPVPPNASAGSAGISYSWPSEPSNYSTSMDALTRAQIERDRQQQDWNLTFFQWRDKVDGIWENEDDDLDDDSED